MKIYAKDLARYCCCCCYGCFGRLVRLVAGDLYAIDCVANFNFELCCKLEIFRVFAMIEGGNGREPSVFFGIKGA